MTRDAPQSPKGAGPGMIRRWLAPLRQTPLHPQWLVLRYERAALAAVAARLDGDVLDIGCADRRLSTALSPSVRYVGLDYPDTAVTLYDTRPDVYGDAQCLPFSAGSFSCIALLDVLEHLPDPDAAVAEAARVLAPGGTLALGAPFLYPLHDQPFDFQRWTRYGLRQLVARHGLSIIEEDAFGQPGETAALLANIALARRGQRLLADRNPLVVLVLLLAAVLIPQRNLAAWLSARTAPPDDLMPLGYRLLCRKPEAADGH